ncbi:MAG: hypothetical protein JW709_10350, partial [Sedimentisphaerales bacterium]|nr:hypothetical protein [Sedimentisphaerales bacterium]
RLPPRRLYKISAVHLSLAVANNGILQQTPRRVRLICIYCPKLSGDAGILPAHLRIANRVSDAKKARVTFGQHVLLVEPFSYRF